MKTPLRILLVEDSEDDALLILDELRQGGYEPVWTQVQTAGELSEALGRQAWDVIVSDYRMPEFSGPAALKLVRQRGFEGPFIIVSGTIGEELAVETMKAGVNDYVMKDRLHRLAPAIRRELREAEDRRARRRAEVNLQRTADLLRAVADGTGDAIFVKDAQGRYLFFNEAAARFVGRPATEVVGKDDTALFPPADAKLVMARDRQVRESGRTETHEEHLTAAGVPRIFLATKAPYRDSDGKIIGTLGVSHDITEHRQLEEQLRQAQKMEAIGQLAGGIAHDFNNLLAAISGNAQLMRQMPAAEPAAAECLEDILNATHRAADLVRQILSFSRRQEQKRLPVLLQPVVKEALKLLRSTVPANVEFQSNIGPTSTVLADPSEIHQVLMNLCTNAWHALQDQPGVIRVELGEVVLDDATAARHPDLRPIRYVRLTVADDGCGMDKKTLNRMFEPFFTTKPVGVGTGLGLSVVHGIVKAHDGGIVVESRPGKGTTFHLYFPVFGAEASIQRISQPPARRGKGEHILFVDDEEPLARVGQVALERLGYRVTRQTDPAVALSMFRAQPAGFALAVLDYNMPGLNGAELGQKLLEIHPGIPIILTTGYSATLTPEIVRLMRFCSLLPKPYDLRDLGEAVRQALEKTS